MMRVFIGFDHRESIAYHTLAHSIMRRASMPVAITPLHRGTLRDVLHRPRGPLDSTDFAISRFLVPALCDYQGWALFMDSDMLCLGDVADLARYMTLATRWSRAVHVVKHDYVPATERKFLDQPQTRYPRKNWSSVMLFCNPMCRALTPDYVNSAPGLDLHQFRWLRDDQIGSLPQTWNYLCGEESQCPRDEAQLVHFTQGTPCFHGYEHSEFAQEWFAEVQDMQHAG
jgi:hypothetical protein